MAGGYLAQLGLGDFITSVVDQEAGQLEFGQVLDDAFEGITVIVDRDQ